jgi:hypothetical protein
MSEVKISQESLAVLQSIAFNYYTAFNGSKPREDYRFDSSDFQVWSDCIDCSAVRNVPSGKKLSGIVSSLCKSGMLKSDGECVALTESGFDFIFNS